MIQRALVVATLLFPVALGAQGSLSGQGFGYPAGGLSAQALGTGGALGALDPWSARNPAALGVVQRAGGYFQYAPEFRTLRVGGVSDKTQVARFPLVQAALPLGERLVMALSSTTVLDRSWETTVTSGQRLGSDSVTFQERFKSIGAINDVRMAFAWKFTPTIAAGVGLHRMTGLNRIRLERTFSDSLSFGALRDSLVLDFSGSAFSAGALWIPNRFVSLAVTGRKGRTITERAADSVLRKANVPNQYGFALRVDALPGTTLAASAEWTGWSSLSKLGSGPSGLAARDGWDIGVGAEVVGPRYRESPILWRAGFRDRQLPFLAVGNAVKERSLTIGSGIPVAGQRVVLDIALQRASRSGVPTVQERSWIANFGLTVRP